MSQPPKINIDDEKAALKKMREGGLTFELFVEEGYDEYELGGITRTLALANAIHPDAPFSWRFTSNHPGMVSSA
ncbi:MAG: hypothetical protein ABJ364_08195, partial [Lentilitoribacter sp.]